MLNPAQLMGGASGAKPQQSTGAAGQGVKESGPAGQEPAAGAKQGQAPAAENAPAGSSRRAERAEGRGVGAAEQDGGIPDELRLAEDDNKGDPQSIGHEDFLKLMLTQLENQDPTDPQDTEQMMGQIAQFTTAAGINELKSEFQEFFEHMRSDQSLRAAQLVGREVLTDSGEGYLPEDGDLQAILQLESSAPNLTVEIENEHGERVHREQLGQVSEGEHPFVWDGTDEDGQRLPQGQYTLQAYTEDGDEREPVGTLVGAQVTSVSMGMDGRPPELNVAGLGDISLSDVKRVR
ncbi:flagellar hook assembly protein FlgD [Halorhodospira halochloris]|uniref:Basal-body rod modification protein FlgD n=1 Tax=Halorhodospira halochloris TaxID=1052 RepID=A0A120N061_HALHR|nr:flagellar hook assembly protein FlgD [Halorhodospira halochloris]MBK1651794.1 hypothetical protein [Halorhodospira halochloris]MCG5530016.1 flagellar hook assembly protein FlgD [Halorhodospira halochloris]BAU58871.1 flagellar basal-body rod modification protein FlgD [Halorhodospira halochloris]